MKLARYFYKKSVGLKASIFLRLTSQYCLLAERTEVLGKLLFGQEAGHAGDGLP